MKLTKKCTKPLIVRNEFEFNGKYQFPMIKKQNIDLSNIKLISYSDTCKNELEINKACGVHFFIEDDRFEGIYRNPERSLDKLKQYAFVLTPDFSTYVDMNQWRQIESIGHNRWLGAFWQSNGIKVIPTMSWSTVTSYGYVFESIEKGSIVAVSTLGARKSKARFLRGFNEMLKRIEPSKIICFGNPFKEMINDNLYVVDYIESRKKVR